VPTQKNALTCLLKAETFAQSLEEALLGKLLKPLNKQVELNFLKLLTTFLVVLTVDLKKWQWMKSDICDNGFQNFDGS
jgi:hypothetical protein